MTYEPKPLSTKNIKIPDHVEKNLEKIARNIHETWSKQRIQEGWTFGPERSDSKKEHPGLVPYSQLSEAEKRYDRTTVEETIKSLILLGYKIEKN
ncbi:RyR domain-containing protein [Alteribacter natronophilus]|uniref:RyR domain-containing protein n=1 Tax=Alteribacter natronophilus TaxID=2583810 RepID=UPI00110E4C1C|nr:RyR domain-containing protein [Alteribacter natronophilus]TMW72301.1 Ryanodine receptor Ryr [Alteribacter natronophilus]